MSSLVCARCGATHELSGRVTGERFLCSCGDELVTPPPPRRGWGRKGVLLLGALALPCLLVGGGGVLLYLKRMRELEQSMNTAFRADENVLSLPSPRPEKSSAKGPPGPVPPPQPLKGGCAMIVW